jgi:hypothetical protein
MQRLWFEFRQKRDADAKFEQERVQEALELFGTTESLLMANQMDGAAGFVIDKSGCKLTLYLKCCIVSVLLHCCLTCKFLKSKMVEVEVESNFSFGPTSTSQRPR